MPKILIAWSNYYHELSEKHLASCVNRLEKSPFAYQVEKIDAGCYEIPAVILHYQRHQPFDAYLPLGLLLQGATDHYQFIWEHLKNCFIQFTLQGILFGNGVISAPNQTVLEARVEAGDRIEEAVNAVQYLLDLRQKSHS